MGRKTVGKKGRNVVKESGESSEEAPLSDSAPHISLSDDDGSPSASPKLSRTKTSKKSKIKGKHPAKPAHRKTRAKASRPKSPVPVSIPEPPLISPSISVAPKLYALGGRPATPRDLERVKAKYNIPHSVHLRVPRKGERPEHPHSDGVALHIDLFDLGLRLPLQPFFRKMFTEMKIAPGQLSLPGWRLLTGLEVLWLDIFGEDISYGDLRGLYQLKKSAGLSVAYFATWGVHGNLVRPDPLLKKGYRYGWFVAEGEWGKSIPAGNEVVQVRNFFNEDNITWTKGTCPIHEVGRKVNGVIEKFQILQSEGDVLCTSRLARAGLIKECFQSSSGGDSRMDPFGEDFDAFFSRMSGSSSGTLGTSAKGDRPPVVPGGKGKLPVSSLGGSRGTPATHKRKLGSLFSAPGDLMEGELDPVANKRISHLTDCFLHSSESISTDMAMEADKLDLNERYSRALKACHDAAFYLSHGLRDLSGISAAQTEVEKLRGEVRLGQSREERLGEEVRALQRRLDDHARENSRLSRKLEEVESKHGELLSRQPEMMDKAFTLIMTEVWSVEPELVVPRVEKWVDKSAILKAIEDKRATQAPPSYSPQQSSGVPQVPQAPQADLLSASAVPADSSSLAASVPIDAPVEGNGGEDVPLSS